jgi:hypothetical protein
MADRPRQVNAAQLASRKIAQAKSVQKPGVPLKRPPRGIFGGGPPPYHVAEGQTMAAMNAPPSSNSFGFSVPASVTFGSGNTTPAGGSDNEQDPRADTTGEEAARRNKPFRIEYNRTPLSSVVEPNSIPSAPEPSKHPFGQSMPAPSPFTFNAKTTQPQAQQAANLFSFQPTGPAPAGNPFAFSTPAPTQNSNASSTFTFGQKQTSSTPSAGFVFGSTQPAQQPPNPFFASTQAPSGNATFTFGQQAQQAPNPFAQSAPAPAAPATNVFGQLPLQQSTPSQNLFGAAPQQQPQQQPATSSGFFGAAPQQQQQQQPQQTPSMSFGRRSSAGLASSIFAQAAPEPASSTIAQAAPQPASSVFAQAIPPPANTPGVFGFLNNQQAPATSNFFGSQPLPATTSFLNVFGQQQSNAANNAPGAEGENADPMSTSSGSSGGKSAMDISSSSLGKRTAMSTGSSGGKTVRSTETMRDDSPEKEFAQLANAASHPSTSLFGGQPLADETDVFGHLNQPLPQSTTTVQSNEQAAQTQPQINVTNFFGHSNQPQAQSNNVSNVFGHLNQPQAQSNIAAAQEAPRTLFGPPADSNKQTGSNPFQSYVANPIPPPSPKPAPATLQPPSTSSFFQQAALANGVEAVQQSESAPSSTRAVQGTTPSPPLLATPQSPVTDVFSALKSADPASSRNIFVANSTTRPAPTTNTAVAHNANENMIDAAQAIAGLSDSVLESKCPARMRALNKGIKKYWETHPIGSDFGPAMEYYITLRNELMGNAPTKRKLNEAEVQQDTPNKRSKPTEPEQHAPATSFLLTTQPAVGNVAQNQQSRPNGVPAAAAIVSPSKPQSNMLASTTPKAPPPSKPLFSVPASPNPLFVATAISQGGNGKRKAAVQITKDHPEEEDAAQQASTATATPIKQSATSNLFQSILAKSTPPTATAATPATPAAPTPTANGGGKRKAEVQITKDHPDEDKAREREERQAKSPVKSFGQAQSGLEKKIATPGRPLGSSDKQRANPFASLPIPGTPATATPAAAKTSTFNIFGSASTPAMPAAASSTPANIFGSVAGAAAPTPNKNLFGSVPAAAASSSTPAQNLFGSISAAASSSTPAKNLFGSVPAAATPSSTPAKNLFESTSAAVPSPATSTNMFAAQTPAAAPAPSMFAASSATNSTSGAVKPPTFGAAASVDFMAQFNKSAEETERKAMERAKDEDMDSDEDEAEWEANWKAKRAEEKKAAEELAKTQRAAYKGFTFEPAATPAKPASSAPTSIFARVAASSTTATASKPPTFGTGAPVDFMAQFNKSAEEAERKAMERAKEEDMDSDEDEAEWEANWKVKRAEDKKAAEELAKTQQATYVPGKGFTIEPAASTPKPATPAPQSIFSQLRPATTNPFAAASHLGTDSPGAPSSRASSVFEGVTPGKPLKSSAGNIFGHLSDVDSGVDSGRGNDADEDTDDEDEVTPDDDKKDSTYQPASESSSSDTPTTPVAETGPGLASAKKAPTASFFRAPSNSGTSTPGGSLFDRITKDASGNPVRQLPTEEAKDINKPAGTGIFGGSTSTPFKFGLTGPADQTWKQESPIKFGSSTTSPPSVNVTAPTPTKANPFASLLGDAASKSGSATPTSNPSQGLFGSTPKPASPAPTSASPFAGFDTAKPATTAPASASPFAGFGTAKPTSTPSLFQTALTNKATVGFNFGATGATPASSLLPSAAGSTATSRATSPGLTTDGEGSGDPDAEKHEQINLTSGGPGEENEDKLIEVRAKALQFEVPDKLAKDTSAEQKPEWVTKGLGPLRVLKDKTTGVARILLRKDPSGAIVINRGILGGVKYEASGKTVKLLLAGGDGSLETWLLQVKTEESAKELARVLEENKKKSSE